MTTVTPSGWLKDPRFKVEPDGTTTDLLALDKKFETLVAARGLKVGTGVVDLSPYCVAMNQYTVGSCTGCATCESLEILENISTGSATVLSRLFTYAMARTIEGTLGSDEGSHVRTCFETLALMGVCTEVIWPYDMSQVCVSPSIVAQQQAVGHKIDAYYRITSTGDQRLTDVQTALYNKLPVVIGTDVGSNFQALSGSLGPLDVPSGSSDGHALVIVGYDPTSNLYLVKNSWGTSWGLNGFCQFTADYLTWDSTDDLWVPTLAPVFAT
jgi:C1A family cysteine protease